MNKKYLAAGIACGAAAVICLVLFFRGNETAEPAVSADLSGITVSSAAESADASGDVSGYASGDASADAVSTYESPIDFEELKGINEDIIAWLDIPNTDISYAVLQSAQDDSFYLDHAEDGTSSSSGSLFTESTYNSSDFSDPVTIIYGHHMKSGAYFGNLQAIYSDEETFEEANTAVIYLPQKELHYSVFAAVPYGNAHILYYHDFTDARTYRNFLNQIYAIHTIGANFDEDAAATQDDSIVILSTCLKGDNTQRYLVLLKLETVLE